jgi:hypothetical protein
MHVGTREGESLEEGDREDGMDQNNQKKKIEVQEKEDPASGYDTAETRLEIERADDKERRITLPRWSWEDKPRGRILKRGFVGCGSGSESGMCGSQDSGEVCGKCLLERRVLASSGGADEEKNGESICVEGKGYTPRDGKREEEVEIESIGRSRTRTSRVMRKAGTV